MLDAYVPAGERVLAFDFGREAYTSRDILVSFHSASNQVLADIAFAGFETAWQATMSRQFHFPARTVRRMRVVQTSQARAPEQWNVHELRFLNQGRDLPRRPEWRLRAWPNPWEVQLAFDASPVTRWRSWETPFPGMYLDVDFGRDETVDEVRVETSSDYIQVELQLESMTAGGAWETVAARPRDIPFVPQGYSSRISATRELHVRGINYLLLLDTDFAAEDIRDDPASWGLKAVARTTTARLYQVVP
jgi:hypothetical protein